MKLRAIAAMHSAVLGLSPPVPLHVLPAAAGPDPLLLLFSLQVLSKAASDVMQLAPVSAAGGGSGPFAFGDAGSVAGGFVLTVNDFLLRTGLDNLNLFKLVR